MKVKKHPMKFYESTSFFLRVAVFRFRSKAYPNIDFVLVPVCHIGTRQFYDKVTAIVNELDVLLYEGSKMNKLSLSRQFGRYTKLAAKFGLVSQYANMSYKKLEPTLPTALAPYTPYFAPAPAPKKAKQSSKQAVKQPFRNFSRQFDNLTA
jgi:hypothetical protein